MTRPSTWRTRLTPLVLIWLIGAGGLLAPAEVVDALRSAARDALAPGRFASIAAASHVQRAIDSCLPRVDPRALEAARAEAAAWRARALRDRSALAAREGEGRSAGAAAAAAPLVREELLPATVLGREADVLRQRFARILNRGGNSGVAVDDLVLAHDAPLLDQGSDCGVQPDLQVVCGSTVAGRIRQVGRWTSTMELVTDPAYRGSAQLVREAASGPVLGAAGVLAGNGDGTCRLDLIAPTAPVSIGDLVYSHSQDTGRLGPLYYGRVVEADLPAGAEYWSITVVPALDPDNVTAVQIVQERLNPGRVATSLAADSAPLAPVDRSSAADEQPGGLTLHGAPAAVTVPSKSPISE